MWLVVAFLQSCFPNCDLCGTWEMFATIARVIGCSSRLKSCFGYFSASRTSDSYRYQDSIAGYLWSLFLQYLFHSVFTHLRLSAVVLASSDFSFFMSYAIRLYSLSDVDSQQPVNPHEDFLWYMLVFLKSDVECCSVVPWFCLHLSNCICLVDGCFGLWDGVLEVWEGPQSD